MLCCIPALLAQHQGGVSICYSRMLQLTLLRAAEDAAIKSTLLPLQATIE